MSCCSSGCLQDSTLKRSGHNKMDINNEKETIVRLRDAGTDNIATDKNRNAPDKKMKTFVKHLTMSGDVPPLTTHILDTAVGLPAANVSMVLSRQNSSGGFDKVEQGKTNNDGRGGFLKESRWQPGVYKLYFNTDEYFKKQNTPGFYPYVEVVFRIIDPSQHYHVPLLLSPYGYSTYRGS